MDENPRLNIFPVSQVARCRKDLAPRDTAPWPPIEGCLTALCMARSGSTLLCRQLETLFDVGRMGETLNPAKLKRRSAQEIVAAGTQSWFAFKCAASPLIHLELLGFFDAYLHKTVIVHLVRRDIVAQAVSYAKAAQTGQWHADRKPAGIAVYDAHMIADSVRAIAVQTEQMRRYAEVTRRPHTGLLYEDIVANGLSAAKAAGDFLGLPKKALANESELSRPIEKMGDEVNEEWKERFQNEMDVSITGIIQDYVAAIDLGALPRWATSDGIPHHKTLKKEMEREGQFAAILAGLPDDTAVRARAAVETLRAKFPTGNCFVKEIDQEGKLTVMFGAERGAANAIFRVVANAVEVKLFFGGDAQVIDTDKILDGKDGRKHVRVKDASSLDGDSIAALLERAVRYARTPLPDNVPGQIVIKAKGS